MASRFRALSLASCSSTPSMLFETVSQSWPACICPGAHAFVCGFCRKQKEREGVNERERFEKKTSVDDVCVHAHD